MLVLTRKPGQAVLINGLRVTVEKASRKCVRLSFDGPREVVVLRGELVEKERRP